MYDNLPKAEEFDTSKITYYNSAAFPVYGKQDVSLKKINLTLLEDDRTVLRNPHKGWYWHYIDNGYKRDNYRVNHDPADHLEDFPLLNHLYLRFDWGDIEVEEGVYDWSYIDKIMEEWSKYDYRFSFRFVTYEGDGSIPFATPEYVYKKGARCFKLSGGRLEPDYSDPIYFEHLSRFMEECGRKFNNDPRVELIDMGTYGTWGEGHTGNGTEKLYSNEVLIKHINLHLQNFPNKFLLINDDHFNGRTSLGAETNNELLKYCISHGLGIQDDSLCVAGYADNLGYNSLRTPWLFDYFYDNAPTVLEFEHYRSVSPERFRGGFPFLDCMERTKATFAGFHGYPRPWLEREPYLTPFAANKLGYWYFFNSIEIEPLLNGAKNVFYLNIENRGYSKSYRKFNLKVKLDGDGKKFIQELDNADPRTWEGGTITRQKIELKPEGLTPGNYFLSFGLFDEGRPIKFGTKVPMDEEGFYRLAEIPVIR